MLMARSATPLRTPRVQEAQFASAPAFGGITFLRGHKFKTQIPTHVHSTYVLGVVDDGEVQVTVRGESFVARAGSVLALQPYEAHAEFALANTGWSFRYLYPTEAVVRRALGVDATPGPVALRFTSPVIENDALARAIGRAHDLLGAGRPVGEMERALSLLFNIARRYHCRPFEPTIAHSRGRMGVHQVRQLIIQHNLPRVTMADLSAVTGVSQFHFNRIFHEEVGLPPYAYFDQVRIARAHDMIRAGHRPSAVAYTLGFSDQAHLTRHFHRASFMTPGQYASVARGLLDE